MLGKYKQSSSVADATRFVKTPLTEVEFSRMTAPPTWLVPFNGGDITPVYYAEVLPHDTFEIDFDYVVRQISASLRPTMGSLILDVFAFEVPNRVINQSWRNVQGENSSGYWTAPEIQLAPLYKGTDSVLVPVGSVADLYGIPNQRPIPAEILQQMNDLKLKGYLSIYNNYFRDENYQPPIPFSTLNLYQGFMEPKGTEITYSAVGYPLQSPGYELTENIVPARSSANGNFSSGAITKALFGDGARNGVAAIQLNTQLTTWSALDSPLKANKLHDAFTSVLPSPQKGPEVSFSVSGTLPVEMKLLTNAIEYEGAENGLLMKSNEALTGGHQLMTSNIRTDTETLLTIRETQQDSGISVTQFFTGSNIAGDVDLANSVGITINELRTAIATQQVYEQLARGGSRYWSFLKSFFGIETENPFPDIPTQIGHYRAELDMFQVAQTSASQEGGSPQGSLTAFGYTSKGGALLRKTFLEHGYIHILAVVRHRNLYSTYLAPDNFRMRTLDFYLPQFANISEQPVRLALLNPFRTDALERAIGFQEAWWEYRYEPDRVHGILRSGLFDSSDSALSISLDVWHFGDPADFEFTHVNGEWLVSNTQEVLDRTLAITSDLAPQFIGAFTYKVTKQRPMPVYSIPGLDTI